jgi:hypothetical protein
VFYRFKLSIAASETLEFVIVEEKEVEEDRPLLQVDRKWLKSLTDSLLLAEDWKIIVVRFGLFNVVGDDLQLFLPSVNCVWSWFSKSVSNNGSVEITNQKNNLQTGTQPTHRSFEETISINYPTLKPVCGRMETGSILNG